MQKWEEGGERERERERERKVKKKKKGAGKSRKRRWGKEMEERKRNKRYSNSVLSAASGGVFFFYLASLITLLPLITRAARLVCQPEKHQQWYEKILMMKYNLSFALCSVRLVLFCSPLPSSRAFPAESQFYFLAFTSSLPLFLFKLALYFPLQRNIFLRRVFCAAFIRFPFFTPSPCCLCFPSFNSLTLYYSVPPLCISSLPLLHSACTTPIKFRSHLFIKDANPPGGTTFMWWNLLIILPKL